jgi:hypothetical protein
MCTSKCADIVLRHISVYCTRVTRLAHLSTVLTLQLCNNIAGFEAIVVLYRFIAKSFWGLKQYNRFADSNLFV